MQYDNKSSEERGSGAGGTRYFTFTTFYAAAAAGPRQPRRNTNSWEVGSFKFASLRQNLDEPSNHSQVVQPLASLSFIRHQLVCV